MPTKSAKNTTTKKTANSKKATNSKATATGKQSARAVKPKATPAEKKPTKSVKPKASSTAKKSAKTTKPKATSIVKESTKVTKRKIVPNTIEFYDLPDKYNQTMVKVLFQTPKKLFVYWEIAEADKQKLLQENGLNFFNSSTPFLVVQNDTKKYSFEIEINDYANSWYFDVPDSNCEYSVKLIRKDNKTQAQTQIQTSNELEIPNNHILFEQNRYELFFKNVKTNEVTSKKVANLQFINHIGIAKPATLNDFYNKFYDEKDLYSANNPSSHS